MTTTRTIPAESLGTLGLHKGDILHVLGVVDSMVLVEISHADNAPPLASRGSASAWLKSARGSVKLAEGESPDDARMACYAARYQVL